MHASMHSQKVSLSLLQTQAALFGPIVTFKARADDWNVRDPFFAVARFPFILFQSSRRHRHGTSRSERCDRQLKSRQLVGACWCRRDATCDVCVVD